MNRTKVDWADYSWNPCTGCWGPGGTAEKPNRCPYCYAQGIYRRFNPFEKIGYIQKKMSCMNKDPFQPLFWPKRLSEPAKVRKPSKIFVCSMADLFGDWVPEDWIAEVQQVAHDCPQHTFQFLTKNPKRLKDFNPWPSNCWVGCTVTNQADADERLPWLVQVEAPVRFASHEPLLNAIDPAPWLIDGIPTKAQVEGFRGLHYIRHGAARIDWAIIGAQTGPGAVKPKPEWVQDLIDQYREAGVFCFLKDNLKWPEKIQEFPLAP